MNAYVDVTRLPAPVYPPHARTYRYDEVDREFLAERIAEFSRPGGTPPSRHADRG